MAAGWGLALGALVVWMAVQPGYAATGASNGGIAFVTARNGYSQIFFRSMNGVEKNLSGSHTDGDPEWNPYGTKLAFSRGGNVWVMNAAGTIEHNLTPKSPSIDGQPSWSPNGKQIVFVSDRATVGRPQLFVMNADGSNVHRLLKNPAPDSDPEWSPAGVLIAFVVHTGTGLYQIHTVQPTGANHRNISGTSYSDDQPAWSPSGLRIMFNSTRPHTGSVGADLWTMKPDGTGKTQFLHEDNGYSDGSYPAYSPDGTQVVFSANNGGGSLQLWTAPVGGGQNTQLTTDPGQPYDTSASWRPIFPAPSLRLTTRRGPGDASVQATGVGFAPREQVSLTLVDSRTGSRMPLGTATTSATGSFGTSVTVPSTASAGSAKVIVTGKVSGLTTTRTLSVTH